MNDYIVPLNTMSADCGPFSDYISPLCLISNSVHLELLQKPVDHRSSDISYNNSSKKFSSVSNWDSECECQGLAYGVCTLCLHFFNLVLIFFTNVSCVQFI